MKQKIIKTMSLHLKNVIFLLLIFVRPGETTYLVNPNNLVTGTTTYKINLKKLEESEYL